MKKLKTINCFEITGRGTVFVISLKENNFSNDVKIFKKQLKLKEKVIIKDELYEITGLEINMALNTSLRDEIGVLVKKLNNEKI